MGDIIPTKANIMTLPKPKYCKQEWLEMKPTDGGRICGQCEKTIIDFSKMTWKQIKELQENHKNSLCGMYAKRQLKHWGQEPAPLNLPYKSAIAASSILLTLGQLTPTESYSQTIEQHQNTPEILNINENDSQFIDSLKNVIIEGVITTKNEDGTIAPLPFANVYLRHLKIGAVTDFEGKYRIEINEDIQTIRKDTLTVTYIGYISNNIILNELPLGQSTMNIELIVDLENITYFYVKKPSIRKRIGWSFKKWFGKKEK